MKSDLPKGSSRLLDPMPETCFVVLSGLISPEKICTGFCGHCYGTGAQAFSGQQTSSETLLNDKNWSRYHGVSAQRPEANTPASLPLQRHTTLPVGLR